MAKVHANAMPVILTEPAECEWRLSPCSSIDARFLRSANFTDAIRALHPNEQIYTFWDYLRNAWTRDAGLRLDHFLVSPRPRQQLSRAGVDRFVRGWEKASDHAPAWIELEPALTEARENGTNG